jgi:beta-galactosidase
MALFGSRGGGQGSQPPAGATLQHGPFIWDDVPYEPGTLEASGSKGGAVVRAELRTAGAPARILLKPEKTELAAGGGDAGFLEADVVDAAGVTVPGARPWIQFTVQGPARLLGAATEIDAIAGVAAINVQTLRDPGEITVTAASPGLESGSVRLRSAAR